MPFIKVRGDGVITIPVELRRKHSVTSGTWCQVSVTSKGKIVLCPKHTVCPFYGAEVLFVDAVTDTYPHCKTILTDMVRSGFDSSNALKHTQRQRKNGSFQSIYIRREKSNLKRSIASLFAAPFSVFVGVEYAPPKDDNFYMSSAEGDQLYFKVNEGEEVLYKSLYRSIRHTNPDAAEMCDPTPRQDTRDSRVEIPDVNGLGNIDDIWRDLYSPVAEGKYTATKMSTKDGAMFTVNAAENVNITAPAVGEINTSHYACDGGSTMEHLITWLDGNVYTMTISDTKCWYCCAYKSVPEDESYTATTGDSLKGKAIRAGDVLYAGKEGTTISIVRVNT